MKRLLLSGLLLIFLLNLVGWQWIFIHQQNLHHESVWNSNQTAESKAVEDIIRVSNNESKNVFMINSHEMVFHGMLYDVSRIERTNTEIVYYCSADNEEEQIIASFDQVVKSNLSPAASTHSKNVKTVSAQLGDYLAVSPIHLMESNNSVYVSFFSSPEISEPFVDAASIPPEVGERVLSFV